MLASLYFRAEVRGLEQHPRRGPGAAGGQPLRRQPDAGHHVFTLAFNTYFGVERRFYQLAHNLVLSMPGLGLPAQVRHGRGHARRTPSKALDSGAALLVYPGGDYEVHRPELGAAKVDFGGRKGFIRLALDKDVPIVPVVSVGGQETALFLTRGERLAKLLRLDEMFRLKVLPISLAMPWGLNVGDMLGHCPLPAKITIQVLEPIDLRERYGDDPDLDEVYDDDHRAACSARLDGAPGRAHAAGDRLMRRRGADLDRRPARARSGSWSPTPRLPALHGRHHALRAPRATSAEPGWARATRCACASARPTSAAWSRSWSTTSRRDLAWTSVTGIDQRGRWRLRETDDGRTRVTLRLQLRRARAGCSARSPTGSRRRWCAGNLERSASRT